MHYTHTHTHPGSDCPVIKVNILPLSYNALHLVGNCSYLIASSLTNTCLHVSIGVSGSQEKWVDSLKRVARFVKVESGHLTVKFDEIGVLSFGSKIPSVLATAGFQSFSLDVLMTFFSGLTDMFQNLLRPQPTLTGKEYEIFARILLGFQAVVIFGVKAITPIN